MKTLCSKISSFFRSIFNLSKRRRTTVLNDGASITKPKSYSIIYIVLILFVFLYFWNMIITDYFSRIHYSIFFSNVPEFFVILDEMITFFNISFAKNALQPMIETIQISILGTLIGATISYPIAVMASKNIMNRNPISPALKVVLSIIRSIPMLLYAFILTFIFDYGAFVGVLATILFSVGIITKMLYEIIEAVNMDAFIAIEATGATKVQAFSVAVAPQVQGRFYSIVLYTFEINLRASAILGFVNAGGIGMIMNDQMNLGNFGNVAVLVLVLLLVVLVVENLSQILRRRLT